MIPDYGMQESYIAAKQVYFDLNNEMKEEEIRDIIVRSCKCKLPNLSKNDFVFVKRDQNRICTPSFDESYAFDFAQVKKLAGTGKIYIRLKYSFNFEDDDDSDDLPVPPFLSTNDNGNLSDSSDDTDAPLSPHNDLPGPSSASAANNVSSVSLSDSLREIFPNLPMNTIEPYLTSSNLQEIVNNIADHHADETQPSTSNLSSGHRETADHHADQVKTLVPNLPRRYRETLFVNQQTILDDCFAYYKNPNFNPKIPLRIKFIGQVAIDAGGPTRQFYSLVADKVIEEHFVGNDGFFLPKSDANTVQSDIFVAVGKIVAHSIVHGSGGLPFFSPSTYNYLCHGNIAEAMALMELNHVVDAAYSFFINEVSDKQNLLKVKLVIPSCLKIRMSPFIV